MSIASRARDGAWHQRAFTDDAGFLAGEDGRPVIATVNRETSTSIATAIRAIAVAPIDTRAAIPFDVEFEDASFAATSLDA